MKDGKLTAALIGLGRIGSTLEDDPGRVHPCTHAGTVLHFPDLIRLKAVCDSDLEKCRRFCSRWGFSGKIYQEYQEILKEKSDLVIIASSTASHYRIAAEAINSGAGLIVLEKPVTDNISEALELLSLSEERGVPVMICHDRRYSETYRKLKKFIRKEAGGLIFMRGEVIIRKTRLAEKNPLLHDGTHLMDLAVFFAGKPVLLEVETVREGDFISAVFCRVWFEKNICLSAVFDSRPDYYDFQFEVSGKRGKALISNTETLMWKADEGNYENQSYLRLIPFYCPSDNPYLSRMKEALDFLKGKRKTLSSDIRSGYLAEKLCDQMWKQVQKNIGKEYFNHDLT